MILQINEDWRIASDAYQWSVQKRTQVKGETVWKSLAYFIDPAKAAVWCAQRRIREVEGTYPAADALELLGDALGEIVADTRRMVRHSRTMVQ